MRISFILTLVCFICITTPGYAAPRLEVVLLNEEAAQGEALHIDVRLHETMPDGEPDMSAVKQFYDVTAKGRSNQVQIVNGAVSTTTSWRYTLIPDDKNPDIAVIPRIAIKSQSGILQTDPYKRDEQLLRQDPVDTIAHGNAKITSKVDKAAVFVGEPFTYTVTIHASDGVADIELEPVTIQGARTEKLGEPETITKIGADDETMQEIRVHYLVTPIKEGGVLIPKPVLHGKALSVRNRKRYGSIDPFNDPFDLLNIMGMNSFEPFTSYGQEMQVTVNPPASTEHPWLPLRWLKLEEQFDETQQAEVGQPVTRTVIMEAIGTYDTGLPSIEEEQKTVLDSSVRLYGAKPETNVTLDETYRNVRSWKKENLTYIPTQPGEFILPEIVMPWWNLDNGAWEYARIPAKTLTVTGQAIAPLATVPAISSETEISKAPSMVEVQHYPKWWVWVVPFLSLVSALVFLWGWRWRKAAQNREVHVATAMPEDVPTKANEKELLQALQQATEAGAIRQAVEQYVKARFALSGSLKLMADRLHETLSSKATEKLVALSKALDAAQYGGKSIDPAAWKQQCLEALSDLPQVEEMARASTEDSGLPPLNPTRRKAG